MKLVIESLGFPSALAGKPVALPLPVSIANVQKVFALDGRLLDPAAGKLIRRVATSLTGYIENHLCPAVTLERLLRQGAGAADAA